MTSRAKQRTLALAAVALMMAGSVTAGAVDDAPDASMSLKVRQSAHLTLDGIPKLDYIPTLGTYDADPNSRRGEPGESGDWCHRDMDPAKEGRQELQCKEVRINVTEAGAWRLRVAILTARFLRPELDIELWGPQGAPAPRRIDSSPINSQFRRDGTVSNGAEVYSYEPAVGEWVLRIVPLNFKVGELPEIGVRAKLEALRNTTPVTPLLPNLRPEMPLDRFTFGCHEGTDTPPTPTTQGGQCLRFPFAFQNAGSGPLELDFDDMTVDVTVPVSQKIYLSDATPATYADNPLWRPPNPAGTATWHAIHAHYHYDPLYRLELLRVLSEGQLGDPEPAAKRGTCAHDLILVGFKHFHQDVQGMADSGDSCRFLGNEPTGYRIGLSAGWGDMYAPGLSDNYVPFPPQGEGWGKWVVRMYVDRDNHIVEKDESDNVGYAYIEVSGNSRGDDSVRLLEAGRGTSPWDPNKTVVTQYGQS